MLGRPTPPWELVVWRQGLQPLQGQACLRLSGDPAPGGKPARAAGLSSRGLLPPRRLLLRHRLGLQQGLLDLWLGRAQMLAGSSAQAAVKLSGGGLTPTLVQWRQPLQGQACLSWVRPCLRVPAAVSQQ